MKDFYFIVRELISVRHNLWYILLEYFIEKILKLILKHFFLIYKDLQCKVINSKETLPVGFYQSKLVLLSVDVQM